MGAAAHNWTRIGIGILAGIAVLVVAGAVPLLNLLTDGASGPSTRAAPFLFLHSYAPGRIRTFDLGIKSPLLYQLSYGRGQSILHD